MKPNFQNTKDFDPKQLANKLNALFNLLLPIVGIKQGGTGLSQSPRENDILLGTIDGNYVLNQLIAGAGITLTKANSQITISSAGTGYSTVEDEGVPLTQRATINFTGAGVTATDVGGKTKVDIPSVPGPTGAQGPAIYIQDEPGQDGDIGPPGQGLQGPPGPKSDAVFIMDEPPQDGEIGPQGAQGNQGIQGITGAQGPQGAATFLDADPGEQGLDGIPGNQGPLGPVGPAGPLGPPIFVLETGESGDIGPPGPQGIQGYFFVPEIDIPRVLMATDTWNDGDVWNNGDVWGGSLDMEIGVNKSRVLSGALEIQSYNLTIQDGGRLLVF